MKKKAIYINDLHFEHKQWMSELEFQRGELKSFIKRLEEVVVRWTDKEILRQVEHFQNQFILHDEVIDTLVHDINLEEEKLSTFAASHPVEIDHVHFEDHGGMRERNEDQSRIFTNLRKEYMRFLTTAM